ncbi:uncharacterized protein LOC127247424 [Andrographis paniculata]|uniref:uncharacterized protein LOC127247424 n=1 Tax=Andrographis paniculata TaxID=175694 RepID=UPI0021E71FE5|nr:uncharacterized protein LOC127247424 [Andrographis paniculata]
MDDSWRLRMGMPAAPPLQATARHIPGNLHRRSAVESPKPPSDDANLDAEDFSDVFGGPPRTILSRQFSTGFPRSSYSSASFSYEEIFLPAEKAPPPQPVRRNGRSLPQFRIPVQMSDRYQDKRENTGFYSDIFGWEDEAVVRSRSRSKTNSSSILSPDDLSPLRPAVSGDGGDDFAFLASQLRPINVKSRCTSRRKGHEDYQTQQDVHNFAGNQSIGSTDNDCGEKSRSCTFRVNPRNRSPETISLEPVSNGSFGVSADDLEHNSPISPAVSTVSEGDREHGLHTIEEQKLKQYAVELDENEVMSSYVIEINSHNREGTCESNGVDEAIAWAKEKFQTHCPVQECEREKLPEEMLKGHHNSAVHTDSLCSLVFIHQQVFIDVGFLDCFGSTDDVLHVNLSL